ELFFEPDLKRQASALRLMLFASANEHDIQLRIEQDVKEVKELCNKIDDDARGIIAYAIRSMFNSRGISEDQKQMFHIQLQSFSARSLRNPLLIGIVQELPPHNYDWPQIWPRRSQEPKQAEMVHWLALHRLRAEYLDLAAIDPTLFSKSQAFPN